MQITFVKFIVAIFIMIILVTMALNIFFPAYAENEIESCPILTSVEHLNWFSDEAKEYIDKKDGIWKRGESAIIVDIETGIYFFASRNGGDNHADWECETKEDTARLKKIYNGKWSWDKRAALILIGEKTFAVSIHGNPHGGNRIKANGLGGHICAHFLGSKFHSVNKEAADHQQCVEDAFNCSIEDVQILINEFYESSNLLTNIE